MANLNGKVNPVNETEKKYIQDNHHRQTVIQMAKKLGRGPATIYRHMYEENLNTFCLFPKKRKVKKHEKKEFFRHERFAIP